ncbi:MAG: hypothetical protein CL677_04820 [Bdellovibrionaceae bacterium]|nr:hypothetical protein [Pseudobdellovibrionaceae bacterium]|tara:strand:+ start:138253 stop:139287 length:1035 start_codon:yes stop_codon:yes gene_type:complete
MCGLGLRLLLGLSTFVLINCSDVQFEQLPVESTQQSETPPVNGKGVTESFEQTSEEPKLDILVIVDNSPSMRREQRKLGERMSSFTSHLEDVDWQISVTNTDVSSGSHAKNGHLFKFEDTNKKTLTKHDPDYNDLFLKTVVMKDAADCVGGCPSTTEQPLAALGMAISMGDNENYELFRDNSDFAVIIISDEDEMSTGPSRAMKPRKVLAAMNGLFPEKNISVHGVIIEPGDRDCKDDQGYDGSYGTHVAEFARITNGVTTSICADDYAYGLSDIGQVARQLLNSVTLSRKPLENSVSVSFSPFHATNFSVSGKKILFEIPPPAGTQITVNYAVDEGDIVPLEH